MSEHSIKHLGEISKQILEVLRTFMHEVMNALNVLKRLPEIISDLRKDINEGLNNIIQSTAEMEIYIRMANLKSKKSLINAESEAISDFKHQLKEDFKKIDDRYTKINNELDSECKKRIREIDNHLLEIPEKFPNELYSTFNDEVIPLFKKLANDTYTSFTERFRIITEEVSRTISKTTDFLTIREDFFEKVKNYEFQEKIEKEKQYYIPLWVVEFKDNKGNTRKKVLLPSKISYSFRKKIKKPRFETLEFLKDLKFLEQSNNIQKKIISNFKWEKDNKSKIEAMKHFTKYFKYVRKNTQDLPSVINAINKSDFMLIKK